MRKLTDSHLPYKDVEFKLATLANDAGICGAAKLLLDAVGEE